MADSSSSAVDLVDLDCGSPQSDQASSEAGSTASSEDNSCKIVSVLDALKSPTPCLN